MPCVSLSCLPTHRVQNAYPPLIRLTSWSTPASFPTLVIQTPTVRWRYWRLPPATRATGFAGNWSCTPAGKYADSLESCHDRSGGDMFSELLLHEETQHLTPNMTSNIVLTVSRNEANENMCASPKTNLLRSTIFRVYHLDLLSCREFNRSEAVVARMW